jgi:hypothetical protein
MRGMRAAWCFVSVAACGGGVSEAPTRAITQADLQRAPNGPPLIAPRLLEPYRVTGSKTMIPDPEVIAAARNTNTTLRGSFEFCLDPAGDVGDVRVIQSTGVLRYDQQIAGRLRDWAFRPIIVDGNPIAVCSIVTFVFTAH